MDTIELIFPIEPVAKGRPRLGRYTTYTPDKTYRFEDEIWKMAKSQYKGKPIGKCGKENIPLHIDIEFGLVRPKSVPKRRAYPAVRPDIDNYDKAILDALNGVVFVDDGQIVSKTSKKVYSKYDKPYIKVLVREVNI